MEDSVLNNGGVHMQTLPQQRNGRIFNKNKKVPDIWAIESQNWLLHKRYIRHEYKMMKNLIDTALKKFSGNNEYANYLQAMILRKEGKIQISLDFFQTCYNINSININNIKQIAKSLFLLGNHKRAIDAYLEAFKVSNIPDWQIHHGLGECYVALDSFDKAQDELQRAVELTKNVKPYLTLARLYANNNKINNAIQVYIAANSGNRSSEYAVIELGIIYIKIGDVNNAFEQFGSSVELRKSPQFILPMTYIIQIHEENDVAMSKYKISLQTHPESFHLWNNIGMCLFKKQKYIAAISCLKKAHYLNPLALLPALNLGKVFLIIGQPVSAAIYLCSAIVNAPKIFMTYLLLGAALQKLGDFNGAKRALSKAHSLSPQNPLILINYALILKLCENYSDSLEILANLNDISVVMDIDKQITHTARKLSQIVSNIHESDKSGEGQLV